MDMTCVCAFVVRDDGVNNFIFIESRKGYSKISHKINHAHGGENQICNLNSPSEFDF